MDRVRGFVQEIHAVRDKLAVCSLILSGGEEGEERRRQGRGEN